MANTTTPPVVNSAPHSGPPAMTPQQEMASLISQVAALSMAALDLTSHTIDGDNKVLSKLALRVARTCVEINEKFPRIIHDIVDSAVAGALRDSDPLFVITEAPSPADVEGKLADGNENAPYYVVCVGREPGLYLDSAIADDQVRGVPDQARRKITGRTAALNHYRDMYNQGKAKRVNEV
ncbi:hypothetical protein R3P38DRAFT_3519159 [Favolaschia claudopus]|uniref:Uncharacterized protein n=1 Tax=Favolaschia claudopus TaxID=2862362 RepID=A0AAW0BQB9_9AGAR